MLRSLKAQKSGGCDPATLWASGEWSFILRTGGPEPPRAPATAAGVPSHRGELGPLPSVLRLAPLPSEAKCLHLLRLRAQRPISAIM